MKVSDILLYARTIMDKVANQLSVEERTAFINMVSMIRHEFNPDDDSRLIIDGEICRIRWMEKDIMNISKEEEMGLTESDVGSLIHGPGFAKKLRESCLDAGTEYIIREIYDYYKQSNEEKV